MTSDLDIYRAANVFIKRYGEGAAIEAAMRADKFLKEGQTGAYLVWKRIVQAVNEIQRKEPREGETVN